MSDDPMRILVVEPTKDPYVKEIDGSLTSMQAIVGGFIQAVEPFKDHNSAGVQRRSQTPRPAGKPLPAESQWHTV